MNIGGISSAQNIWPLYNQRPETDGKEPTANAEIQKLTKDIEKEENELKRLSQEFSKCLSDGEQDMAKLKSAEMTQKQMQIQSMRLQISKLENPEKSGETDDSALKDSADYSVANYDRYIKSDGQPEPDPGVYSLGTDGNGNQIIIFDRQPETDKVSPAVGGDEEKTDSEDGSKKKIEVGKSVGDDSRWKTEIDKLKQKKAQLLREIGGARGDEDKRHELETRLAQTEAELAVKDTESYRKQRTVIRYLGSRMMDAEDAATLK